MSKISGKKFGEGFRMRVVSGMLVNGAIKISWATGEKAASQFDWGFTKDVENTTDWHYENPADMKRYHTFWFPKVLIDADHFFRVRSKTLTGKTGVSDVFKVIVPNSLQLGSELPQNTEIKLTIINVTVADQVTLTPFVKNSWRFDDTPEGFGTYGFSIQASPSSDFDSAQSTSASNFSTNHTITITT